jgi:hypothetical protein
MTAVNAVRTDLQIVERVSIQFWIFCSASPQVEDGKQ